MDLTQVTMKNLKTLGFPGIDKRHMLLRIGTSEKQPKKNQTCELKHYENFNFKINILKEHK